MFLIMAVWGDNLEPHSTFGGILSQASNPMEVILFTGEPTELDLKNLRGIFNDSLKARSKNCPFQ